MLEIIRDNWILLTTLLVINLAFLAVGVRWPRRARDIREHPQWSDVQRLVDQYVLVALPRTQGSIDRAERERDDDTSEVRDILSGRPRYVAPDADDAHWFVEPEPAPPAPHTDADRAAARAGGFEDAKCKYENAKREFEEAVREFTVSEPVAIAEPQPSQSDGALGKSETVDEPATTFLEWFAARERFRLRTEPKATSSGTRSL